MPLTPPTPPADLTGVNWNDLEWNDGSFTRVEYRAKSKEPPPDDTAAITTPRRPVWLLKIFWDGDGSAETNYSDHAHTDLPAGTEYRVLDWGQVIQSAKGFNTFDTFRVTLQNLDDATSSKSVSDEWTFADPPEGKLVELHVKVIQPEAGPITGFEQVFTGRISEIPRADETHVELIVASIGEFIDHDLGVKITAAAWPKAPSDSLEKIQPVVFGEVLDHEAVLVEKNLQAVLASSLTSVATSVSIETDPGLSSSGTVQIDSETMTYSAISAGTPATLTGVVRGTSGTTATDHPAGVLVTQVGDMSWVVSSHANGAVSNPRLVDSAGNIRQIPSDVTTTITGTASPAKITVNKQPVISSLASDVGSSFKFVDLDSADLTQCSISGVTPTQEVVEQCLGRATTFVDTSFVTMTNGTHTPWDRITGYRAAAITGIPDGAVLKKAYAVVEGYNDGTTGVTQEAATTMTIAEGLAAPFTLTVDSTAGFLATLPTGVVTYFFIGEECFDYDGTTATSFSVTARNVNASSGGPFAHATGATVRQGPVTCAVRDPGAGASTLLAHTDREGDVNTTTDTPEEVEASTGMMAISKGFEDAHTHDIPGNHTHVTDTEHTHDTTTYLDWVPDIVFSREVKEPQANCTPSGAGVGYKAMVSRGDLGASANGEAGDGASWNIVTPGIGTHGWFFIRSSSAALAPDDNRTVTGIQITFATRALAPWGPAGTATVKWKSGGAGGCFFDTEQAGGFTSDLALYMGNLGTSETNGELGSSGIVASYPIQRDASVYDANKNSIYIDSFTTDFTSNPNDVVSSATDLERKDLKVKHFVDEDLGGSVSQHNVWFRMRAPQLNIQAIKCRLLISGDSSATTIPTPLADTANPDTDAEQPLKRSHLSWFDLSPKITSADDLLGLRFRLLRRAQSPYPDDYLVLRMFYVLEYETVSVSGDTETPDRMICDVQGIHGGTGADKAHWILRDVFNQATLLNLGYDLIPATEASGAVTDFSNLSPVLDVIGGVMREATKASTLINDICAASRLLPAWSGEGKLTLRYLESKSDIQSNLAPVVFFNVGDLQPTQGGISRPRAPIDQIINDVTIRTRPNAVSGGWGVTSTGESAGSKTKYGLTKSLEEETLFLSGRAEVYSQIAADKLRDHRLDYGAESPSRVTFRVHLTQKALANTGPGAIIGVDVSPDFLSASLQVERRVIDLGVGRSGSVPFVEFQCVDRTN